jgi:uncharacterized coiled-coil DUF342 family protein
MKLERVSAGNEVVRLKVQLAEEVDAHAKTAKELRSEIDALKQQDDAIKRKARYYDGIREMAKGFGLMEGPAAEWLRGQIVRIAALEKDRDRYKDLYKVGVVDVNAKVEEYASVFSQLEEVKAERDRYRCGHEEALESFQSCSSEYSQLQYDYDQLKAENASLAADAGYWRALKKGWKKDPFSIGFYGDGCACFRNIDGEVYEDFKSEEDAVSAATNYKPEAANEG